MIRIAAALSFLLLLTSVAHAMTFREQWTADNKLLTIHFEGKIVDGDYDRLLAYLARNDRDRLSAAKSVVSLNSPGGAVLEAMKIARVMRDAKQAVAVESRNECISACFMLFAAGTARAVGPGAYIAVHSVSVDEVETQFSTSLTVDMARDLLRFGVPVEIIGRLVTTGPKSVYRLTDTDLRSMADIIDRPAPSSVAQASPSAAPVLPAQQSEAEWLPVPPSGMMYGTAKGMPGNPLSLKD
jgi:hypothetical protein